MLNASKHFSDPCHSPHSSGLYLCSSPSPSSSHTLQDLRRRCESLLTQLRENDDDGSFCGNMNESSSSIMAATGAAGAPSNTDNTVNSGGANSHTSTGGLTTDAKMALLRTKEAFLDAQANYLARSCLLANSSIVGSGGSVESIAAVETSFSSTPCVSTAAVGGERGAATHSVGSSSGSGGNSVSTRKVRAPARLISTASLSSSSSVLPWSARMGWKPTAAEEQDEKEKGMDGGGGNSSQQGESSTMLFGATGSSASAVVFDDATVVRVAAGESDGVSLTFDFVLNETAWSDVPLVQIERFIETVEQIPFVLTYLGGEGDLAPHCSRLAYISVVEEGAITQHTSGAAGATDNATATATTGGANTVAITTTTNTAHTVAAENDRLFSGCSAETSSIQSNSKPFASQGDARPLPDEVCRSTGRHQHHRSHPQPPPPQGHPEARCTAADVRSEVLHRRWRLEFPSVALMDSSRPQSVHLLLVSQAPTRYGVVPPMTVPVVAIRPPRIQFISAEELVAESASRDSGGAAVNAPNVRTTTAAAAHANSDGNVNSSSVNTSTAASGGGAAAPGGVTFATSSPERSGSFLLHPSYEAPPLDPQRLCTGTAPQPASVEERSLPRQLSQSQQNASSSLQLPPPMLSMSHLGQAEDVAGVIRVESDDIVYNMEVSVRVQAGGQQFRSLSKEYLPSELAHFVRMVYTTPDQQQQQQQQQQPQFVTPSSSLDGNAFSAIEGSETILNDSTDMMEPASGSARRIHHRGSEGGRDGSDVAIATSGNAPLRGAVPSTALPPPPPPVSPPMTATAATGTATTITAEQSVSTRWDIPFHMSNLALSKAIGALMANAARQPPSMNQLTHRCTSEEVPNQQLLSPIQTQRSGAGTPRTPKLNATPFVVIRVDVWLVSLPHHIFRETFHVPMPASVVAMPSVTLPPAMASSPSQFVSPLIGSANAANTAAPPVRALTPSILRSVSTFAAASAATNVDRDAVEVPMSRVSSRPRPVAPPLEQGSLLRESSLSVDTPLMKLLPSTPSLNGPRRHALDKIEVRSFALCVGGAVVLFRPRLRNEDGGSSSGGSSQRTPYYLGFSPLNAMKECQQIRLSGAAQWVQMLQSQESGVQTASSSPCPMVPATTNSASGAHGGGGGGHAHLSLRKWRLESATAQLDAVLLRECKTGRCLLLRPHRCRQSFSCAAATATSSSPSGGAFSSCDTDRGALELVTENGFTSRAMVGVHVRKQAYLRGLGALVTLTTRGDVFLTERHTTTSSLLLERCRTFIPWELENDDGVTLILAAVSDPSSGPTNASSAGRGSCSLVVYRVDDRQVVFQCGGSTSGVGGSASNSSGGDGDGDGRATASQCSADSSLAGAETTESGSIKGVVALSNKEESGTALAWSRRRLIVINCSPSWSHHTVSLPTPETIDEAFEPVTLVAVCAATTGSATMMSKSLFNHPDDFAAFCLLSNGSVYGLRNRDAISRPDIPTVRTSVMTISSSSSSSPFPPPPSAPSQSPREATAAHGGNREGASCTPVPACRPSAKPTVVASSSSPPFPPQESPLVKIGSVFNSAFSEPDMLESVTLRYCELQGEIGVKGMLYLYGINSASNELEKDAVVVEAAP